MVGPGASVDDAELGAAVAPRIRCPNKAGQLQIPTPQPTELRPVAPVSQSAGSGPLLGAGGGATPERPA